MDKNVVNRGRATLQRFCAASTPRPPHTPSFVVETLTISLRVRAGRRREADDFTRVAHDA